MTTRYTRNRLTFEGSLASDYSRPFVKEGWEKTYSTLDELPYIPIEVATTGTTVNLDDFGTVSFLAIYNEDATNFVEAEWYYSRAASFADTVTFAQAATGDTITDDSAGGAYVTNGSRAGSYVRLASCATAGNNGTRLIRSTTTNVITLVAESTMTADAADAVTLEFLDRNTQRIATADFMYFNSRIDPALDLLLTANTAACICRVYIGAT